MWDRALFAVRRFSVDLGVKLGSWRLSIVLMVLAALYYGLLAIWATSSPPYAVQNIASLAPFWIVYALMLVNTGVCLWRRIPTLKRDVSKAPRLTGRPADWEAPAPGVASDDDARRALARLGYQVAWEEPGRVGGIRRRFGALGTFMFHGAFFLIAAGFLATLLSRQEARVWVAAGEDYAGQTDQFLSQTQPRALVSGVPAVPFRVQQIRPEFWRDQLLFTTLEADLTMPGGKIATTRINRPLWLGAATFLRLSGFGYAPRYELTDRSGNTIDSAFVKMNVFPPGQQDYFTIPNYPHRFNVELLPDLAMVDGTPTNRSPNLVEPGIVLRASRGRFELGQALLTEDDGFEFEGLTLRFPEIRYWGEFSIVFDPGAPILFLGYALGLAGLALRLSGSRAEAEWRAGPDGSGGAFVGWGSPRPGKLPSIHAGAR